MTSITRENFKEVFPKLVRDLDEASYIAVDFEFTGITHIQENECDLMRSPEDSFREKIASANMYSPMQMGISIFQGDGLLDEGETMPISETVASRAYQKRMTAEAETFWPLSPNTEPLKSMLCSIASRGTVTDEDILVLERARKDLIRAAQNIVSVDEPTDGDTKVSAMAKQLQCLHVFDEADEAVALAKRWKSEIKLQQRHLLAKNYTCYLIPASSEEDDRTICLSTETMKFLRYNAMDYNKWIDEALSFVSLEEYLTAKRAAFAGVDKPQDSTVLDAGIKSMIEWAHRVQAGDSRVHLISEIGRIENFARTSKIGDSIDSRTPFFSQHLFTTFSNLLASIGLRLQKKILRKVSHVGSKDDAHADQCSRFFGTRVLYALINATRNKQKPLIIHNGALDLSFLISALYGPLTTLKEVKRVVRELFPIFYDTRTLTCAPSLQYISNLTGPLKKTYTAIKELEKNVRIYNGSYSNDLETGTLKEHDAASDAFMSGALFALTQNMLEKTGADFRRLRCITPLHGCLFSVLFESDETNCLVQQKNAPIFHIKRPAYLRLNPDDLRVRLSDVVRNVTILLRGENCFLIVGEALRPDQRRSLSATLTEWSKEIGVSINPLDIDTRSTELNISYISEKAN